MAKLKPLRGQYIVQRVKETETMRNGLVIPDQAQEKPFEGIIISAPDASDKPNQAQEGDRVLFGRYTGIEIKFAGDPFLVIKEEDILGLVIPDEVH